MADSFPEPPSDNTAPGAGPAAPGAGQPAPAFGQRAAQPSVGARLVRWLPLAVAATVLFAFLPALNNEFVNWDDDRVLLDNHGWRGLGGSQLVWMFTQGVQGHYHPLTWISFAVDYTLWGGLDPFGFHLTNVVLHAANAALFYWLALGLLRLSMAGRGEVGLLLGAGVAALLFGLHPLRVESVAWATERRDVLSLFFLIPCLLCYLRYAEDPGSGLRWYVASLLLLTLSLLSKAWGITLPVVLLVLDFYPLRRLRWRAGQLVSKQALRAYLDKLPFVLPAAWIAYLAVVVQAGQEIMKPFAEHGFAQRLAQACYGLVFYAWKTLVPTDLAPIYEIPVDMNPLAPRFLASAAAVVVVTVVAIALRKRWPAGLTLWICYVVVVSPVLGIAQSGPQLVADRYSYVCCLVWALLGGAGVAWCWRARSEGRLTRGTTRIVGLAACAVLVMLGSLTWRQCKVWRTSWSLWEHTLAVRPDSWHAHVNLGVLYSQGDAPVEAISHLNAALAIKPDIPEAHANIAPILAELGREEDALEHIRRLREVAPDQTQFLGNVGVTLFRLGRTAEAVESYREALRAYPDDPVTHANLAIALQQEGDLAGTIIHLVRVVELVEVLEVIDRETAQTSTYGKLYVRACTTLRALYFRQGDRASAKRYGQKLRALGLGGRR